MRIAGALALFARMTRIPDRIAVKNRRQYGVAIYCIILCLFAHVVYLVLFGSLGVSIMYYYNYFSIAVFATSAFFVQRLEKYVLIGSICSTEVILHNMLATACVGYGAGFQYMLIALGSIAFLMFPTSAVRKATLMALGSAIAALVAMILFRGATPIYIIPAIVSEVLFILNLVILLAALVVTSWLFVHYVKKAEDKAAFEFERAEVLLRNILPDSIAERLKNDPSTIADGFDCTTVLFTDIVDFTKFAEKRSPAEVVSVLNDLFSRFDMVAERHGLEKIKTIGDAYMVASGIPEKCEDNAHAIADFALDIQDEIRAFNEERGFSIAMRVGINSGPVVAGVIGRKKFIYDLWGDAVNMASRMESHGLPGRIQVTEDSYALLKDDYELEYRGQIEVKGKGMIPVWLLNARKG